MTRIQNFLLFCGAASALGLLARLPYLPWSHPYFSTLGSTLLLSVVALRVSRRSESAALNLFCWGALPLTMLAAIYEKRLHPELTWSAQMFVPLVGLLTVALLSRDGRSLLVYALGSAGATAWMVGELYGRQGAAGVALFVFGVVGGLLLYWVQHDPVAEAQDIQATLDEQRGELEQIKNEQEQERLHGPP
jgi:hypothetical protein